MDDCGVDIGSEWSSFCQGLCQALTESGQQIIEQSRSTLDRDEGLRVLIRDVRYSMEREIEERDPDYPILTQVTREVHHLLADAPDYFIQDALIDGANQYRLSGQLGIADSITFTTMGPNLERLDVGPGDTRVSWSPFAGKNEPSSGGGGKVITGTLDGEDLALDEDGNFEFLVAVDPPPSGVWLPMAPETDRIIIRNIYHSRFKDHRRYRPAKLVLERIGSYAAPPAYRTEQLVEGLEHILSGAGKISLGRSKITESVRQRGAGIFSTNEFWLRVGSNPRTHFQDAYWELEPDQALVIDLPSVPHASFWSLGLTNYWMESLDFRFHPVNMNSGAATLNVDGSLRVVVAGTDPGVANWLDTAGHSHGIVLWRWNDVEQIPLLPTSTLVPVDKVRDLPIPR